MLYSVTVPNLNSHPRPHPQSPSGKGSWPVLVSEEEARLRHELLRERQQIPEKKEKEEKREKGKRVGRKHKSLSRRATKTTNGASSASGDDCSVYSGAAGSAAGMGYGSVRSSNAHSGFPCGYRARGSRSGSGRDAEGVRVSAIDPLPAAASNTSTSPATAPATATDTDTAPAPATVLRSLPLVSSPVRNRPSFSELDDLKARKVKRFNLINNAIDIVLLGR